MVTTLHSNLATLHEILQLGFFALFQFLANEWWNECLHESGDTTKYNLAEFAWVVFFNGK